MIKQENAQTIAQAKKILEELKVKRGGAVLKFHRQMANDPILLNAFSQMYDACNRDMKHIPRKYREMIIFAVGCAVNAPTTINVHAKLAMENGATADEMGEVLRMVFFLTGVTGMTPGLDVLEQIED
ncbi:MAG: carboxymuconolactone decarboxylase family protein [Treponemataceae bacterium]